MIFKTRTTKDVETTMVVLDALIALLDKKQIVSRQEMQEEITLRSQNDIVTVGGIEYKVDKKEA